MVLKPLSNSRHTGATWWDRETESLWWPILDVGVSGVFTDHKMKKLSDEFWEETTWLDAKTRYPNAQVIQANQSMSVPSSWQKISKPCEGIVDIDCPEDNDLGSG